MSHSSLLAKSRFCSVVLTNQSILLLVNEPNKELDILTTQLGPSPIDESDEEIDISTDLFVLLLVSKPNQETDVSTNQFISSSIDKLNKKADKDIYLFWNFIKIIL